MSVIIQDETTGESFSFNGLISGYRSAADKIEELEKQGHKVGGDVERVWDCVQPSWRETNKIVW